MSLFARWQSRLLNGEPPEKWREVLRRPSFRMALLRQAVPVLGVLVLGWPAIDIALFFLLDVWLYLTVRATCEITFDPKYGTPDPGAWALVKNGLVIAVSFAVVVGMFGLMPIAMALPGAEWDGLSGPAFLVSLVFLLGSHLWDGVRFLQRLRTRTAEERRQGTLGIRVMAARLMLVTMAPFVLSLATAIGQGGRGLVLLISGVTLWLEAFPERVNRILGFKPGREYE